MSSLLSIYDALLGFAAVFMCVGVGFLFLQRAVGSEGGSRYWPIAFFLNGAGFVLWAGMTSPHPWLFFVFGDALHMLGFTALVYGIYRFTGLGFRQWNVYALVGTIASWVAGMSLVAWGVYAALFPLAANFSSIFSLAFGLLVGFHSVAALGLVILIVERIRLRAEEIEDHVHHLEGLLPICSYCKRIKDENDEWQSVETYIKRHSDANFSHGICPDCARDNYPGLRLREPGIHSTDI